MKQAAALRANRNLFVQTVITSYMGTADLRSAYGNVEEEIAHHKYLYQKYWSQIQELINWRVQFFYPLSKPTEAQLKRRYAEDTVIGYFIEKVSNEESDAYQPNWKVKMPEYRQEAARQGLDNFLFPYAIEGDKDVLIHLKNQEIGTQNIKIGDSGLNMPKGMLKNLVEHHLEKYSDMKPGNIELSPLISDVLPDWYLMTTDDKSLGLKPYRYIVPYDEAANKNINRLAEIIDLTQADLFFAAAATSQLPAYQNNADENVKTKLLNCYEKSSEVIKVIQLELEQEKRMMAKKEYSLDRIKKFVFQEMKNVQSLVELYKEAEFYDEVVLHTIKRLNLNLVKLSKYYQSI